MNTYIVHMAGKTASQTVQQTLLASVPDSTVERHHFFSPETISELRETCTLSGAVPEVVESILSQCMRAEKCREETIFNTEKPKVIISAYRDPFRQSVSSMFQNLKVFIPDFDPNQPSGHWVEKLIDIFMFTFNNREKLSQSNNFIDRRRARPVTGFCNWFEIEFNEIYGVNIYDMEIDEIGTVQFEQNNKSFIIYKTESLYENFDRIFSNVPGIKTIKRVDTNIGNEKPYAELYKKFLDSLFFTDEMHEHYYENRFYRNFYT